MTKSVLLYAKRLLNNKEPTTIRQSAEWGMLALKESFPRFKDWFNNESYGERKVILEMITVLYNIQARKVGIVHRYMRLRRVNFN
jgi:hypothetical protein